MSEPRSEPILASVLSCPACGARTEETMPEDACVIRWECPGCGTVLRPRDGDCCVFCSHGSVPCPPVQSGTECGGGRGSAGC